MIDNSGIQSVLAQIASAKQSLASRGTAGVKANEGAPAFSEVLTSMVQGTSKAQNVAADYNVSLQKGDPNVSVEETVLAMNKASLQFNMTLQTRNKLVQAYSDIMNMPI